MSLPNYVTAQWRLWGRENRRRAHGGGPSEGCFFVCLFFSPVPQWFDCFCPHFAEKWWCKHMLELAAHCASNVAALAAPQKKLVLMVLGSRDLILVGLLLLKDKAHKLGQGLQSDWGLDLVLSSWLQPAELQQCWRRSGFSTGFFITQVELQAFVCWRGCADLCCTAVSLSTVLRALCTDMQSWVRFQPACSSGKATWLPEQTSGAALQDNYPTLKYHLHPLMASQWHPLQ